jgi:FkbM family methyltransferase
MRRQASPLPEARPVPAQHNAIVGLLKRLPIPAARLGFAAYKAALRSSAPAWVTSTHFGARIRCEPTDLIQGTILNFGVWEPDVSRTIERTLSPGDVFVDIGANIGYDSLLASSRVGAGGQVVAIEASPRTFGLLQANLARNSFATNVRAVNVAVSDRPGKLNVYNFSDENIGATTTLAARAEEWRQLHGERSGTLIASVDALPLREILTPNELQRVRLIKMDVEGAEPEILANILAELAEYPATMDILVEASDDVDAWRAVFKQMAVCGFSAWAIENEYELEWYLRWRPTPLRRLESPSIRQQDLLLTRREKPASVDVV